MVADLRKMQENQRGFRESDRSLIDGKSLLSESKLSKIGVLKLQECMVLKKSYLRLRYKVIH